MHDARNPQHVVRQNPAEGLIGGPVTNPHRMLTVPVVSTPRLQN
jgi:hypothetical protein